MRKYFVRKDGSPYSPFDNQIDSTLAQQLNIENKRHP